MISIIGGSGFIGSRVSKLLSENLLEFSIVDKCKPDFLCTNFLEADVCDFESLSVSLRGSDSIINLAAEHRDDVSPVSLYHQVNVLGAENVCAAAEHFGTKRIIFTSTVAVYGFAPLNTGEDGELNPFNEYGVTKLAAEHVYKHWQMRDPSVRTLVIVRPTVVFGEGNRGNVYNLLSQIAKGLFVMIGPGKNVKSMAYVENVAAFMKFSLTFGPGIHTFNYVDKPDMDMNTLVSAVYRLLGKSKGRIRLPYMVAMAIGRTLDVVAAISAKKFPISAIRVKKFCADTMFSTKVSESGFIPPYALADALEKTIKYEFLEDNSSKPQFHSE
jgi:nucleoside-diphosphate-sugar epimerase